MKKKFMAIVLAGALSAFALTGCGNDAAAVETTAPAEAEAPVAAAEETGSGFSFSDLQDNYALMVDAYNQVEELYMSDEIEQSDDVEELLGEAKALIEEMGELSEDDFSSEAEMIEMNDNIVTIMEGLSGIIDMMDVSGESSDTAEVDSDISFVDGFYANDGSGDFMIAFYEGSVGDVAYINDGTDEAIAEYTVEEAYTEDGDEYLLVTVGALQLGYVEDGDDIYLIDDEGNVYAAARLSEEEADALYSAVSQ